LLADGGVAVLRPLLELPELELAEPELRELVPADDWLPDFDEPDEAWTAVPCAGPGSVYVTPAAVSTLAMPAAAVTALSLARFLFRLATADRSGVIGALPLVLAEVGRVADTVHIGLASSAALLRTLSVACGLAC